MSYTSHQEVKVKEDDSDKFLEKIFDFNQECFNQECVRETGDEWYLYDVEVINPTTVSFAGDPYDVGAFMIRCFGQEHWQGGFGKETMPVWDGTYDPQREIDAEMTLNDEE